jgi:hypothetical protein
MTKRSSIIIICLLLLTIETVFASSLTLAPGTIPINNAARGEEYYKDFKILGDLGVEHSLYSSGEISDWVSYYDPNDLQNPISSFVITDDKNYKTLKIKIKIPEDAPNGDYTSQLVVQTVPGKIIGSGSVMSIQMKSDLEVTIVGEQDLSGKVKSISVKGAEQNSNATIKITFENNGNVTTNPVIETKISRLERGKEIIIDTISQSQSIKPNEIQDVIISWATEDNLIASYSADIKVSMDGDVLRSEKMNFKIIPEGELIEEEIIEYPDNEKGGMSTPGFEGIYLSIALLALFALHRKK